jgi:hypothetical protein
LVDELEAEPGKVLGDALLGLIADQLHRNRRAAGRSPADPRGIGRIVDGVATVRELAHDIAEAFE